jgi:hypothetical protein
MLIICMYSFTLRIHLVYSVCSNWCCMWSLLLILFFINTATPADIGFRNHTRIVHDNNKKTYCTNIRRIKYRIIILDYSRTFIREFKHWKHPDNRIVLKRFFNDHPCCCNNWMICYICIKQNVSKIYTVLNWFIFTILYVPNHVQYRTC